MPPRIVLVRTKEAGNIGGAARAMKNFGLEELYLVAPRCSLRPRAYHLASHAGDLLDCAVICETLEEALANCSVVVGTSGRPRASDAFLELLPDDLALTLPDIGGAVVFGSEDFGLSNEELDRCQSFVRIPTASYPSLNLAQAVGLIAYTWFTRRSRPEPRARPTRERASREEHEAMYAHLLKVLHHIGYTDELRTRSAEHLFRRMFDRAELDPREISALRGLWQQVKWAADQPPGHLPGHRKRH